MKKDTAEYIGRLGGLVSTKAKAAAARRNGLKGGRPRRYPPCLRYKNWAHRFRDNRCPCGFRRKKGQ